LKAEHGLGRFPGEPLTAKEFGAVLAYICKKAGIRTRTRNGKVFSLDKCVELATLDGAN
jgi:hypothetical protein